MLFHSDEIQYMKSVELGALIAALHRSNQLGYPVMLVVLELVPKYTKCYLMKNLIPKDFFL